MTRTSVPSAPPVEYAEPGFDVGPLAVRRPHRKTHQSRSMYSLASVRHVGTWREFTAAVSAAGGAPVAVAAVGRIGAQRSARGRAVRAGGPAPEPGLLPPAPAARRWACLDASQRS